MAAVSTCKWTCDRCQELVYTQDTPQNWMSIKANDRASDIAIGSQLNAGPYGHFCSDCASSFKQWLYDGLHRKSVR